MILRPVLGQYMDKRKRVGFLFGFCLRLLGAVPVLLNR